MFSSMTQNIAVGLSTIGTQNRTTAPQICRRPYSRSALIHLSAMIPAIDGMNSEAMPIVEKIAPNDVPDQCLFWNQYAPIVSSHEPQTKNWRKFMTIRRSFRLIGRSVLPSGCRSVAMLPEHRKEVCVVAAPA